MSAFFRVAGGQKQQTYLKHGPLIRGLLSESQQQAKLLLLWLQAGSSAGGLEVLGFSNREHTKSPGGPARTVGANWLKIVSKLDSLRLHGGDGVTARLWVWTVSKF